MQSESAGSNGAPTPAGLAKTRIEQGDFVTAQKHLARALAIVEAKFPPEHVDVLRTLSSIATLNRRRGEYGLARQQFEDVLARFEPASA